MAYIENYNHRIYEKREDKLNSVSIRLRSVFVLIRSVHD